MVGVGVAEGGGAGGDTAYYGEYYSPEQYFVPQEVCTNPHHPHHPHMCTVHPDYGNAGMPVVTSPTMLPQMMPQVLDDQMRHYLVHQQHGGHPGMHHHPQHHPPPPHHHQPPHHYGPANGAGGPQQYFGHQQYPAATHFHPLPPHMQASPPPPPPAYQKDERTQRQYSKLKQKLERNKTNRNNGIDLNSGASTPSLSPRKELNGTRAGSGGGSGSGSGGASSGVWSEGEGSSAGASVTGDEDDTQAVLDMLSATRTPQVSEMTPTSALVQWNSPLPEGVTVPSVELTYELLLGDRGRYKAIYSGPSLSCRVRDLRPGCEYSVCLQIRAGTLTGAASEAATFRAPAAPPERLAAPRVTQRARTSLLLRWGTAHDNGARITHYLLEADRGDGDGYRELAQPRTRQHTATGLEPQTRYRIRIAAVNDRGRGDWSEDLVVSTAGAPPPAPAPPTLLSADADRLALAWERRANNNDDFTLQMDDERGHGFLAVYAGPELKHTCVGLRRASDYRFRLRCESADGPGAWSAEVRYRTAPERPGAPGRPTLRGKPKPRELRLRWDPPVDDGGSPCDYQLELDDGTGFREAYSGPEREAPCERLRPGTEYAARVRARSEAGASPWSVTETVTTETIAPSACAAPELAGKPRATAAAVRWRAPDCCGGATVEKYRLRVVGAEGERVAYEGPATECIVRDLTPGTEHALTVTAHNRVGAGPASPALSLRTPPAPPDAPPAPTAVAEDATTARVSWEVPRENGAAIIDFRLEMSGADLDDAFAEIFAGLETTFLVRDLVPFSPYFFRVSATNSAGRGPRSPARDLLTPGAAPGAPTDLRHDASPDSMTLSWTAPPSHGAEIVAYRLQIGESDPITIGPVPEHRLDGLTPDTAYRVRVAAQNELGVGPWSVWASPATRPLPPAPPALELVQRAHNFLKLRWGEGVATDGTQYCLETRGPDAREFRLAYRGAARSCKVKKLREGTTYAFRIRAHTAAGGRGMWSAPLLESTGPAPPPAPRAPVLEALGPRSLSARWDPLDRAQYVVQVCRARDGAWRDVYTGAACSATLEDLEAGLEHLVRVCGVRGGLAGGWSPAGRVLLPAVPAPAARRPRVRSSRRLSPRHEAMLMVSGFLLVAVLMAVLVQRLVESRG